MLLMLSASGEAIRRGRAFAVQCAQELGADADAQAVVELLASEVVTNAVKFGGPDGTVAVRVRSVDGGAVRIEVSDDSDVDPRIDADRPAHLGGHGMKLVALLASDWGVDHHPSTPGKTVWMVVPLDRRLAGPTDTTD
jgi:anti-sigma regulatory factor (Ser/Thr protein kinase)